MMRSWFSLNRGLQSKHRHIHNLNTRNIIILYLLIIVKSGTLSLLPCHPFYASLYFTLRLFVTFSVLVTNPKKILHTVV